MKRLLMLIFILLIISIVACQKAIEKKAEVTKAPETPKVETTGEAVVDNVGKDLTNVNSIEKDLSTDELSDLDAGLADIQNI